MRDVTRWMFGVGTLLSLAAPLSAQGPRPDSAQSVITVSSQGEIHVVPDRARILLSVETRASTAATAASDNAGKQSAVIAALRSLGISPDKISTQNYTIYPETRNDKIDGTPRVVSYRVSNSILVELSNLSSVGRVIDSALASGANQVASVDFYESNARELYRKALAEAVTNARSEAEVIATAAGGHLGRMLEMNSGGFARPMPAMRGLQMDKFAAAATPMMPGEDTISASVNGRWVFIPDR